MADELHVGFFALQGVVFVAQFLHAVLPDVIQPKLDPMVDNLHRDRLGRRNEGDILRLAA